MGASEREDNTNTKKNEVHTLAKNANMMFEFVDLYLASIL